MMDKNISDTIKLLRLPLAFLIVAGHANTLKFPLRATDGSLIAYDYDIIKYPIHLLSDTLFGPAVPLFFMISGFLFFAGMIQYSVADYRKKLLRRAKTLLIPYLIWNCIYMLPILRKTIMGSHDYNLWYYLSSLWIVPNQYDRIAEMSMATPIDPPLWFIRDLMVCMVLSPVIWLLARRKYLCVLSLGILGLPWIMAMPCQYPLPGISVPSLLFFFLGSAVAIWKIDIAKMLKGTMMSWILIGLYVVLAIIALLTVDYSFSLVDGKLDVVIDQNGYLAVAIVLFGCLAFLSLSYFVVGQMGDGRRIWGGAFSVFASHWILLVLTRMLFRFCPAEISQLEGFLIYLLLVAVGFGGGLVINYLISKNRILLLLFAGGRS